MIWVVIFLYLMGAVLFHNAADDDTLSLWPDNTPVWMKLFFTSLWPFVVAFALVCLGCEVINEKFSKK